MIDKCLCVRLRTGVVSVGRLPVLLVCVLEVASYTNDACTTHAGLSDVFSFTSTS